MSIEPSKSTSDLTELQQDLLRLVKKTYPKSDSSELDQEIAARIDQIIRSREFAENPDQWRINYSNVKNCFSIKELTAIHFVLINMKRDLICRG